MNECVFIYRTYHIMSHGGLFMNVYILGHIIVKWGALIFSNSFHRKLRLQKGQNKKLPIRGNLQFCNFHTVPLGNKRIIECILNSE